MIRSIIAPMKPVSKKDIAKRSITQAIIMALFAFALVYSGTAHAAAPKKDDLDYRRKMLKQDHLQAGNIYYKIEAYEKAVDQFEQALEIDPQDKKTAALLDSAKNKMGIAVKPAVSREEEKRLKKLRAQQEKEARIEAKKKEAQEAAAEKAKAREDAEKARALRQAEEKKALTPVRQPVEEPAKPVPAEPEKIEPDKKEEAETPTGSPAEEPVEETVKEPVKEPVGEPSLPAAADKGEKFPSLVSGKTGSTEPVVVNGDKVEYFHEQKRVVGVGNVSIEYRDVLLTCDKITVYLDTREAIAEGNVRVAQKGGFFTGDKVSYNFDTRKASVIDGYLNANPFYGRAKEVTKIANKDQFDLDHGYMTTCDLDKPHYRIQSKKVKIYLGDKVVAHHIFLFVGKVPIFYFPYYVQPLDEKKTHVTVIPGESKEWGYYALTSFRYYLDDKNKGDVLLDYRSKDGLAAGINHYYTVPNLGNGALKIYYARSNSNLAYEKTGPEETRYRYQVRHDWNMGGNTDTNVTFELNKLSDPDVIKDYFYNEYEELGTVPDNYLSIVTQKSEYSAEFLMRKSFNDFYNVVERLPEYKFDIPNLRLLDKYPLYYKLTSSASYLNNSYATTAFVNNALTDITPKPKDVGVARVDAYNQVSYAARVFKALNLTPYVGLQETYYSRDIEDKTNVIRSIFKTGIDASIKFYKIYKVTSNFMGLDINDLRHIITPTVNYHYIGAPSISRGKLNQFDEIDAISAQNGVTLGLENRLQTKRGSDGQMQSVDLATLYITTDYNFELENGDPTFRRGKFDSIDFELDLIPYSWAYLVAKMSLNPNAENPANSLETASIDLVSAGGDKWNLSSGYRYENVSSGLVNLFTMDGMYKINEKWRIRAYERFNLRNGAFEEQEYTVSRDLHCWIAEFTYNYRNNGDQSLWFVLKLKAFPDYPVGLKRTYSRPRFGSTNYQP